MARDREALGWYRTRRRLLRGRHVRLHHSQGPPSHGRYVRRHGAGKAVDLDAARQQSPAKVREVGRVMRSDKEAWDDPTARLLVEVAPVV